MAEVAKWLAFIPYPQTIADAENWIQYCIKNVNEGIGRTGYHPAIELKGISKNANIKATRPGLFKNLEPELTAVNDWASPRILNF